MISYTILKDNDNKYKYSRKLEANYPSIPYESHKIVDYFPCHWGQRKLLFSEIFFKSEISLTIYDVF